MFSLCHVIDGHGGNSFATESQTFCVSGILGPVNVHPVHFSFGVLGDGADNLQVFIELSFFAQIHEQISQGDSSFGVGTKVVGANFILLVNFERVALQ